MRERTIVGLCKKKNTTNIVLKTFEKHIISQD